MKTKLYILLLMLMLLQSGTEKFKLVLVSQPHYYGSIKKEWVESTDVTKQCQLLYSSIDVLVLIPDM